MAAFALTIVAALGGAAMASVADETSPTIPDAVSPGVGPQAAPAIQAQSESRFVPITPCRIVDTRVGGGKIAAGGTRSFYVGGAFGFAPQGGKSGGCGIPVGATAVTVSVAVLGAAGSGYVAAYPTGEPTTSGFVNVTPGRVERAAGTFALAVGSGKTLTVKSSATGVTDLVIDVQGYYQKPLAVTVGSGGDAYSGTSRVVSTARLGTGVYEVTFDREIKYCVATATPYFSNYFASMDTYGAATPDTLRVRVWSNAGVPADDNVYVQVDC